MDISMSHKKRLIVALDVCKFDEMVAVGVGTS